MRVNRGLLFWGLGLVTAGAVALAVQQGVLDRNVMENAWRLWPLILVAIGFSLIVSRTQIAPLGTVVAALVIGAIVGTAISVGPGFAFSCGDVGSDSPSLTDHTGSFDGQSASLDWRLNCGTIDVSMAAGSTWIASIGSTGNDRPTAAGDASRLRIDSASTDGGFNVDRGREHWVVSLPSDPTYDATIRANAGKLSFDLSGSSFSSLDIQPNAADVHLDLADATIEGLDLEMNAGSANMTVSAGTSLAGSIQMNLGSVQLCAPAGTAMRITTSGSLFSAELDGNGLNRSGDTWESPGYASAQQRITLDVHGNLGSFKLNPSGGC